jgi:16S rRNA processing protein RimM
VELVEVGYFSKTFGIKGQLVLKTYRDFDPSEVKAIFVDVQGSKAPFFVSAAQPASQGILISLEEISTVEKAQPLIRKQVFIDASLLEDDEDEESLVGYSVEDKNFGPLGKIVEVSENGAQEVLHLSFKDKELLLPFVDEFIEEIDDEKMIVHYNAPAGLIDLYLEDH